MFIVTPVTQLDGSTTIHYLSTSEYEALTALCAEGHMQPGPVIGNKLLRDRLAVETCTTIDPDHIRLMPTLLGAQVAFYAHRTEQCSTIPSLDVAWVCITSVNPQLTHVAGWDLLFSTMSFLDADVGDLYFKFDWRSEQIKPQIQGQAVSTYLHNAEYNPSTALLAQPAFFHAMWLYGKRYPNWDGEVFVRVLAKPK